MNCKKCSSFSLLPITIHRNTQQNVTLPNSQKFKTWDTERERESKRKKVAFASPSSYSSLLSPFLFPIPPVLHFPLFSNWVFSKGLSPKSLMGCCESTFLTETHPEKLQTQQPTPPYAAVEPSPPVVGLEPTAAGETVSSFSEFSFSDLKAATDNFNPNFIVSESGEKAPNIVYKGRLQNRNWIAVKKFTKVAWPDSKQFVVLLLALWTILLCALMFSFCCCWFCEMVVWNFGGIF